MPKSSSRIRTSACATAIVVAAAGATAASGTAGKAADPGVAKAKKNIAALLKAPTSNGITKPLSKKPPAGKTIAFLQCSQPVCTAFVGGLRAAAAAVGWKVKAQSFTQTPEGIQSAVQAAIDSKPDGIFFTGISPSIITKQLAAAKAAKIPIVNGFDAAPAKPPVLAVLGGPGPTAGWSREVADWVIADSNGKANIEIFNISAYTTLNLGTNAFKGEIAKLCPGCSVKVADAQVTDVGTKLPANVVSTLQRDPKINYLAFAFGDMTIGVPAALKAASLEKQVKLVSYGSASPGNLSDIQKGNMSATSAWSIPATSWFAVDTFARSFLGESTALEAPGWLPHMLITATNAKSQFKSDSNWDFAGYPNYQSAFKKLWHVGG